MAMADDVRAFFPDQQFGPPCTEEDIGRAEEMLGQRFPRTF